MVTFHNCQNVEVTKMFFNGWKTHQFQYNHIKYYSAMKKRNELLCHTHKKKIGRNLNTYILLSKRSQSEKATHTDFNCMIFWKGQNYEISRKISGCQGFGGVRDAQLEHRRCLGQWNLSVRYCNGWYMSLLFVKLFCSNLQVIFSINLKLL